MVCRLRNSATMMASPTATSAAATVRMKKTKTLPSIVPLNRENATSARVEATSISSRHMNTMSVLRRTRTPISPMANNATLRNRYVLSVAVIIAGSNQESGARSEYSRRGGPKSTRSRDARYGSCSFDVVEPFETLAEYDHPEHRDQEQESENLDGQQIRGEELIRVELQRRPDRGCAGYIRRRQLSMGRKR